MHFFYQSKTFCFGGKTMKQKKRTLQPLAPMGEVRPTSIITDPQGSYTGRPIENYEMPVQDADDL